MKLSHRRILVVLGSVALAPILLTILIVLNEEVSPGVFAVLGLWARLIVLVPGFVLLVKEFRRHSIVLSVVYFPLAYWFGIWGSLWAAILLGYADL